MFKKSDFIKETFKGKTIYRILFDIEVAKNCRDIEGEVLDLAGGSGASYRRYLPAGLKITSADIRAGSDMPVDFNERLSFADNSQKNIFFFNSLYIVRDIPVLFKELHRILESGGQLFVSSLFIANEMPEPDDFCRLAFEGLEREFKRAGFREIKIIRIGERFSAAAHLLHPFFVFNFVRLFVYPLCLFFDWLMPKKIKKNHPCPIGYFCAVKK